MRKHAKKGMELPLNTLVILAIVIIVLLAVAALFMGVWGPTGGGISLQSAKTNYCSKLLNTGKCGNAELTAITIDDFDADRDGKVDGGTVVPRIIAGLKDKSDPLDTTTTDNLLTLCIYWYNCGTVKGTTTTDDDVITCCRKNVCGCPQV